jgi:mRNA-degrading endonuclease toxin of MazEF toxin-antitoxin module
MIPLIPSELEAGDIVWAVMRDRRGVRKRRPAIVLTPTAEMSADTPITLMAITTTYPDPPPPQYVELPWNPDRRKTSTGLAHRSAAVVNWLETVLPNEIEDIIGHIPSRTKAVIKQRMLELDRDVE